ncbi:MAG: hypothetical protein XD88_0132, partial [Methanocalculus sp. 52_23]
PDGSLCRLPGSLKRDGSGSGRLFNEGEEGRLKSVREEGGQQGSGTPHLS